MPLERRRERVDRTRALTRSQLERLFARRDLSLRERTLWRLLYETAARASEALSINVEDLELENKRVRVRSKGGDTVRSNSPAGADHDHDPAAHAHDESRLVRTP
jgi:integrase